ncbi:MAG: ATP-binding protein [Bacteroidales bacterium]
MEWIRRILEEQLNSTVQQGKVFVLYGARRAGKTSVIEKYIKENISNSFIGTGDDIQLRNILSSENQNLINTSFQGYDLVFIDEAQRIPNIGLGLKILVDANPNLKIIASGSSSFDLSNKLGAPLTGRQKVYTLFPISMSEIAQSKGNMHIIQHLNDYLIFGTYPEILQNLNYKQKQDYLLTLRNSYLFKDILELENIKNSGKLIDLLKLVAFQIGNEVSLNELSRSLGIAKQTVERYLDLLEKSFIIIKVRGFSSNLRKEVSKTARYYFWDNGIRNSLINNFNEPTTRMDMGMLWENFCFIERLKKQEYKQLYANNYFWRTYDKQEVDLVEEREGKLFGFEFKWNDKKKTKAPKAFVETYSNAQFECITPANFLEFVI